LTIFGFFGSSVFLAEVRYFWQKFIFLAEVRVFFQQFVNTPLGSVVSVSDIHDRKKVAAIYSVDLTAAFDILRKEILFIILFKKGVPKYLAVIIHDYLSDRTGYVQIEDSVFLCQRYKSWLHTREHLRAVFI